MYTRTELEAKIKEVDKAIEACLLGQSYSIGGRTLTRQNLDDLNAQRTRYLRQYKQLTSGGGDVQIATFGGNG